LPDDLNNYVRTHADDAICVEQEQIIKEVFIAKNVNFYFLGPGG